MSAEEPTEAAERGSGPAGPTDVLPMFPLGSVLVPTMVLPLHVFEERYRTLVRDCLAGTPEFGVVLIERGSEVGGGDVRSDVGTVARVVEVAEMPDGRFAVHAVGSRRIRVRRWLDDDPYPRAEVLDWPDEAGDDLDHLGALATRTEASLRRALALQSELGEASPPATVELSDEVPARSHQMAALAPIGPLDRQRLLAASSVKDRLVRTDTLITDVVEVLEARLAGR